MCAVKLLASALEAKPITTTWATKLSLNKIWLLEHLQSSWSLIFLSLSQWGLLVVASANATTLALLWCNVRQIGQGPPFHDYCLHYKCFEYSNMCLACKFSKHWIYARRRELEGQGDLKPRLIPKCSLTCLSHWHHDDHDWEWPDPAGAQRNESRPEQEVRKWAIEHYKQKTSDKTGAEERQAVLQPKQYPNNTL